MGGEIDESLCSACGEPVAQGQTDCPECAGLSSKERYERWQTRQASTQAMGEQKQVVASPAAESPTPVTTKNQSPSSTPSPAFYLLILAGVIGGVIGYFMLEGRDKQMAKRILAAGASLTGVALLFVFVQAIYLNRALQSFGDSLTAPTDMASAGVTANPTIPPMGLDVSDFAAEKTWTFTATQDGGYTESASFEIGNVIPLRDSPYFVTPGSFLEQESDTFHTAGATCGADVDRAAVVPFRFRVTNTTNGFDAQVAARVTSANRMEGLFSGGPVCADDGDLGLLSANPIGAGEFVSLRGFLVLDEYFTPSAPEGDPAKLGAVALGLEPTQDDNDRPWVMAEPGVVGPGVYPNFSGMNGRFRLTGVVPPSIEGIYYGSLGDGTEIYAEMRDFNGHTFSGLTRIFWGGRSASPVSAPFDGTFDAATGQIVMAEESSEAGTGRFVGTFSADGNTMLGTWTSYSGDQSFNWSLTRR